MTTCFAPHIIRHFLFDRFMCVLSPTGNVRAARDTIEKTGLLSLLYQKIIMPTTRVSQLIKERLNFFTAYYSVLISIYFSIIAFPQFLKPAQNICLNNVSISIAKAVAMDNSLLYFNFIRAIAISFVIVFPVVSLWYLNGKSYKLIAAYEFDFGKSRHDSLYDLFAEVALPTILWTSSCGATVLLSLSVGSSNGAVLWVILYLIPFYVIGPVILEARTVPR